MGSKKQAKQVVGHKYYITQHLAICHGPIDAIREVWFADKRAWTGNVGGTAGSNGAWFLVDNEGLFGGTDSEGGVFGATVFMNGTYDQTLPGVRADGTYDPNGGAKFGKYPAPKMGINYRGIAVMILQDFYMGTSAYLKDISFTVERYWAGWNSGQRKIGNDMNAAHIIYECITNSDWGLGYPESTIDALSFAVAADILYREQFGLSLIWDTDQEIDDFINDVIECISATFYLNRRTGLWTLKLIRAGEPIAMTVDPSNSTLESYSRRAMADTYNEISVKWVNPENEEDQTMTVQDLAGIQAQGRAIQLMKDYIGVRTPALAARIAQRDLQTASATLCTVELTTNRQGWALTPGSVVRWNWPPYGIYNLRMRVTDTKQAEPGDDRIALTLVEDVFGQANAVFTGVQEPGWVDPRGEPTLFDPTHVWELPYWYVVQNADIPQDQIPQDFALSTALVSTDNVSARLMMLMSLEVGVSGSPTWNLAASGGPTPAAEVAVALTKNVDGDLYLRNPMFLANVEPNSFIMISDGIQEEIAQVYEFTEDLTSCKIRRGLMDTHPFLWPIGTQVFFMGTQRYVLDPTNREKDQLVQYRPLMQASLGQMALADVPTIALELVGRYGRPYPVANVSIEGSWWPAAVSVGATLKVDWSTRNRLLQDGPVQIQWGEANITPEAGTTFGYELYDANDVLVSSGVSATQTHADVNLTPIVNKPKADYTLHIYSERAGLRNYMDYTHTLNIESKVSGAGGYGLSYGNSYGRA